MTEKELLEIIKLMETILLVPNKKTNSYRPAKNTSKNHCYNVLAGIQEILGTNTSKLFTLPQTLEGIEQLKQYKTWFDEAKGRLYTTNEYSKNPIIETLEQIDDFRTCDEEKFKLLEKENTELKLDPLTHCFNRHKYNELNEKSKDQEYYIAVADINNLHAINNENGHAYGDAVICEVAKFLKKYGTVIRMGGDEFLLIMKVESMLLLLDYHFNEFTSATMKKPKGMSLEEAYELCDKKMIEKKGKL